MNSCQHPIHSNPGLADIPCPECHACAEEPYKPAPTADKADLLEFLHSLTDQSVISNERWSDPYAEYTGQ